MKTAKKRRPPRTYESGPEAEANQREELRKLGVEKVSLAEWSLKKRNETQDERVALTAQEQLIKMAGAYAPEKHETHNVNESHEEFLKRIQQVPKGANHAIS